MTEREFQTEVLLLLKGGTADLALLKQLVTGGDEPASGLVVRVEVTQLTMRRMEEHVQMLLETAGDHGPRLETVELALRKTEKHDERLDSLERREKRRAGRERKIAAIFWIVIAGAATAAGTWLWERITGTKPPAGG